MLSEQHHRHPAAAAFAGGGERSGPTSTELAGGGGQGALPIWLVPSVHGSPGTLSSPSTTLPVVPAAGGQRRTCNEMKRLPPISKEPEGK